MSRKNQHANIINILRDKLEKESRKILNEGGKITPHHIMEGLKAKADDEDSLTCIGRLVQENLNDRNMIARIFHEFFNADGNIKKWRKIVNIKEKITSKRLISRL